MFFFLSQNVQMFVSLLVLFQRIKFQMVFNNSQLFIFTAFKQQSTIVYAVLLFSSLMHCCNIIISSWPGHVCKGEFVLKHFYLIK